MKYLIISVVVLLVLLLTNPSKQDHIEKVRISLKTAMNKSIAKKIENDIAIGVGAYLVDGIVDAIVEKSVSIDNFFIFSITHFRYLDKDLLIGYGILGNVIITKNLQKESDRVLSSLDDVNKDE
jgi:hypothetical protein